MPAEEQNEFDHQAAVAVSQSSESQFYTSTFSPHTSTLFAYFVILKKKEFNLVFKGKTQVIQQKKGDQEDI